MTSLGPIKIELKYIYRRICQNCKYMYTTMRKHMYNVYYLFVVKFVDNFLYYNYVPTYSVYTKFAILQI